MFAKNLDDIFKTIQDHWSPKIIDQINDMDIKAVKFQGDFIWHSHSDTDELFYIHKGNPIIHLKDGNVQLGPGEFYVVPKGVEHKPSSQQECHALLIEPRGTLNTGEVTNDQTTAGELLIPEKGSR